MGSAQAIVNVPASHKVVQQHTENYLKAFIQSANVWFHLKGFGNIVSHLLAKKMQMWKQSSSSLSQFKVLKTYVTM